MRSFVAFFVASLLIVLCPVEGSQADVGADEVHVLIDVSGSMMQNDPENLRTEATELLINLMPENTHVALWLFAEDVKLMSRNESLDGEWRQMALRSCKAIHSRGLYTNIEAAIKTVLEQGFKDDGNKNLIILTDGMVDISKDIMVSADSRERILSEWIPKLQQRSVKVHTIGLSDQVDKELLERLAFDTGGWHETAESAEQLQRLFLKSTQKVAPKDILPLNGNQFKVDDKVREFSLLLFKTPDAAPTQLIAPDQTKLTQNTKVETVSWLNAHRYELITVKQPAAGDWHIKATTDPDSQVMILTDLKVNLEEIANFIPEKQTVPLKVHFTDQGALITRPDFLKLVSIAVSLDEQPPISLEPVANAPGYFSYPLQDIAQGKHNIKLIADGQTFKRELSREFEVVAAPVSVETVVDQDQRRVTLKFHPDTTVLDGSSLIINVAMQRRDQAADRIVVLPRDAEWLLQVNSLADGETILLNFDIVAKDVTGKSFKPLLAPIALDSSLFIPPPASPITEPATTTVTEAQPENKAANDQSTVATIPEEPAADSPHWGVTTAIVLGVNLFFCLAGFFGYKMLRKATDKKQQALLEKLT